MGFLCHTGGLEQTQHHTVVFIPHRHVRVSESWYRVREEVGIILSLLSLDFPLFWELLFEQVSTFLDRFVPLASLPFPWLYHEKTASTPKKYAGIAKRECPKTFEGALGKPSLSGSALSEFLRLLSPACIPNTWCNGEPAAV